eukprot:420719_1
MNNNTANWHCLKCSFLNEYASSMCAICGTTKGNKNKAYQSQQQLQQLQLLLIQIQQALQQLRVQYTHQTQIIQQNFQPIMTTLTNQLNNAIKVNDGHKIQQLQLQQQNIQQQFQSQIAVVYDQVQVQSQQLQANQVTVKHALQIQQISMQKTQQMNTTQIPQFIPCQQIVKTAQLLEKHNNNESKDNTQYTMRCNCCDAKIDNNNNYHRHHMSTFKIANNTLDLNSNTKKVYFIQQKTFYRKMSAYDTTTKKFNVFSPLFDVLNDVKRNIGNVIMFTNYIKLTYKYPLNILRDYVKKNMNLEPMVVKNCIEYETVNFCELEKAINNRFKTWLQNRPELTFPILSKLINFQNPGFLFGDLDKYTKTIEKYYGLQSDMGTPQWIFIEALMSVTSMDIEELEEKVVFLEDKYEEEDVYDIDADDGKDACVYELVLLPFHIGIREADMNMLNINKDWKDMEQVSSDNYVISFENKLHSIGVYDYFSNIGQRMRINSFCLIDINNMNDKNEIMHFLSRDNEYVKYGGTMLTDALSDDKFVEYYKKMMPNENNYQFDEIDDGKYNINKSDIYNYKQPPMKKMKINNIKTELHIPKKICVNINTSKDIKMNDLQKSNDIEMNENTTNSDFINIKNMKNIFVKKEIMFKNINQTSKQIKVNKLHTKHTNNTIISQKITHFHSRKRKRKQIEQIIESPSPPSRSPTPIPKSFMTNTINPKPKTFIKPIQPIPKSFSKPKPILAPKKTSTTN